MASLTQLPFIQPRYYSISSSPRMHPQEIHLTVGVIRYSVEGNNPRVKHGLCSSWLSQLTTDTCVPCFVQRAQTFHLPENDDASMVMIGPGTGIAPFRSFWQEINYQREVEKKQVVNKVDLYFGCRNRHVDNLYAEEVESMVKAGVITNYYLALSREHDTPKSYVQNLMCQNGAEICKYLTEGNCHFYICGDIKMACDVTNCLVDILCKHGDFSVDKANEQILFIKDDGLFHEDIFGANFSFDRKSSA